MLKLVVNSPKGGVGKTTIATNAALEENSEELNSIYIPRWIIAATSSFVKSKYSKLEFKSVEEIVNLVIDFVADKTKSLWNIEA